MINVEGIHTWSRERLIETVHRANRDSEKAHDEIRRLYLRLDELAEESWRDSGMSRMVLNIDAQSYHDVARNETLVEFRVPQDSYVIRLPRLGMTLQNGVDLKTARRWRFRLAREWAKIAMRTFDEAFAGKIR